MVKGEYEMTDTTKYESELKAELKTANKQIDELKTELEQAEGDVYGRDWYIERLKKEHSDFKKEGLDRLRSMKAQEKVNNELVPSLEREARELRSLLMHEERTTKILRKMLAAIEENMK
jgi:septal ring factor EnvC (AmiA/AmiB activator)